MIETVYCQACDAGFVDDDELVACPSCGVDVRKKTNRAPSAPKEKRMQNNVLPLSEPAGKSTKAVDPKKQLMEIEGRIEELVSEGGTVQWRIGHALLQIYDEELWQLGNFDSFRDYVVSRWDFTATTAKTYMRIASTFSEKEASEFGLSELGLLAKVKDDDERLKLAEKVRADNPTFRELAELVKGARQRNGDKTERVGLENTFALSGRLKRGVVAEGGWRTKAGKMFCEFVVGGVRFRFDDVAEDKKKGIEGGWVLKAMGEASTTEAEE